MDNLIFSIIQIVVTVICAIVARYLIPWLRSRLDGSRYELAAMIIEHLVQAVEQTMSPAAHGYQKYDTVVSLAKRMLDKYGIDLSDEQVSALIESAVYAMNSGIINVPVDAIEEAEDGPEES